MLGKVYLDRGRVSDTPKSSENTTSEALFRLTAAVSTFPELLLTCVSARAQTGTGY